RGALSPGRAVRPRCSSPHPPLSLSGRRRPTARRRVPPRARRSLPRRPDLPSRTPREDPARAPPGAVLGGALPPSGGGPARLPGAGGELRPISPVGPARRDRVDAESRRVDAGGHAVPPPAGHGVDDHACAAAVRRLRLLAVQRTAHRPQRAVAPAY